MGSHDNILRYMIIAKNQEVGRDGCGGQTESCEGIPAKKGMQFGSVCP